MKFTAKGWYWTALLTGITAVITVAPLDPALKQAVTGILGLIAGALHIQTGAS